MHAYTFIDVISHLEWSFDSNLLLVGIAKRSLVFVKSLHDPDWQCKIDEGMAGLAHCTWGPNLNHIITVSEFKIRLTIWCLADKSVQYIRSPKFDDGRGICFSPNKKVMVLAEKNSTDGKDSIGIYDVTKNTWECLHHFVPSTFDLENVTFSSDGQHLIIWDSMLKCKLEVYQIGFTQSGVSSVQPVTKFSPYENTALGLRTVQITPNKQYVIGGFFDQKIRVYNTLSWKEIFSFDHRLTELTNENTPNDLNIYSEVENLQGSVYEVLNKPVKIPTLQAHQINSKGDQLPRVGISIVATSRDNKYVATKNEICPNIVWIWDMQKLNLNTVMIQKQEVESLEWCPKTPTLNVSTGNGKLYLWTIKVASVCQVPVNKENFSVHHTQWNPNGKSFAALDKNGNMQQKYIYSYNQLWNILRGFFLTKASRRVFPYYLQGQTFVWRNSYTEGYKVGQSYTQNPSDLSNYLFIRTREHLLLHNRVHSPQFVIRKGADDYLRPTIESAYKSCEKDLKENLQYLTRMLEVLDPQKHDLPAAFASNTLYILERNGLGSRDLYERVLIPILKKKVDYLHAEGVAQVVYVLANNQIWDAELWAKLKIIIQEKNWDCKIVKNERWSASFFVGMDGNEHFFEKQFNPFVNQLFYEDKLNLFELFNSLIQAEEQNPSLELANLIGYLELNYKTYLQFNDQYHKINKGFTEAREKLANDFAAVHTV